MENALELLYNNIQNATYENNICDMGKRLVFGYGNSINPKLMLIGEAPGASEEKQGKPFVGKAGKNLSEFLNVLNLCREDIFISNVVKLRPSNISKAGNLINRTPNKNEIEFFKQWLYREIILIRPKLIVSLGNTALNALMPNSIIGDTHGKLFNIDIDNSFNTWLFPLYHPAAVIYNRSLMQVYNEDLQSLKANINN